MINTAFGWGIFNIPRSWGMSLEDTFSAHLAVPLDLDIW